MPELPRPARVAVVGAGYFGRFHLDAWHRMADAALVALCERDRGRADAMRAEYGDFSVFEDARAMVEAVRPDIVDIATPPDSHLPLIRALAPHAGHIVCQKPFCGGLEGAREAVAVAEEHGCRLAVHETMRHQPWYREAKRLLNAGAVGTPYQIAFRLRPGDGQGPDAYRDRQPYFREMPRFLLHETGIHWIDTFRYLMGEVSEARALLRRLNLAIAGEDAALVILGFESGAAGLLDANRLSDHAAANRRLTMGEMTVDGSGGTLRLDGDGRLWLRAFGRNDEVEQTYGWEDRHFGGDCVYLTNRAILDAWRRGEEPETGAARYLRNLEIVEALYSDA